MDTSKLTTFFPMIPCDQKDNARVGSYEDLKPVVGWKTVTTAFHAAITDGKYHLHSARLIAEISPSYGSNRKCKSTQTTLSRGPNPTHHHYSEYLHSFRRHQLGPLVPEVVRPVLQ